MIRLNVVKGFTVFMVCLFISVFSKAQNMKPIAGTFVTFQYQDQRNQYMNPPDVKQDAAFWRTKLKEYQEMGLEYIIIQFSANEGKAFYPSQIMPHAYPEGQESPVSAIVHTADNLGMKVMIASGWAYDQYDDTRKGKTRETMIKMMKEISGLYKDNPSFYGWYVSAEADLSQIIESKTMVKDINLLTKAAKEITPDKKVMISPYGIFRAPIHDKRFAAKIQQLNVDIIAYQDEIGCVRESFPIPKMKENFKKVAKITKDAGIEFWSNVESFTWSNKPNSHYSALIPAPFPRYLSQIVGANQYGAQNIISFAIFGIMDNPYSSNPLGQPGTSAKYYNDYMDWKAGKGRWSLLEKTFQGEAKNDAKGKSVHFYTSPASQHGRGKLTDGNFGTENDKDSNWLAFNDKEVVVEIDMDKITRINSLAFRYLNFKPAAIKAPQKIDYYLSHDGIHYKKAGTVLPETYLYDHLDCWIDLALLKDINEPARYIKIVAKNNFNSWIYCDEIIVNADSVGIYKVGHRGARGLMPENTIPSFKKAIEVGANTIEFDVHITKDSQVVVYHDNSMTPAYTTKQDGSIIKDEERENYTFYQMDYAKIRKFIIGEKFYPSFPEQEILKSYAPLMTEMIDSIEHFTKRNNYPSVTYLLEVKSNPKTDGFEQPNPETYMRIMMEKLKPYMEKLKGRLIVQSFDMRPLQVLHKSHPHIPLGFLTFDRSKTIEENIEKMGFVPDFYNPHSSLVSPEFINKCHEMNMKVMVWTVQKRKLMQNIMDMGADGIITDYPNRLEMLFK